MYILSVPLVVCELDPAFLISVAVQQSFNSFYFILVNCFAAVCLLTAFSLFFFCSVIGSLHNGRAVHVHRSVISYYSAYVWYVLMLEITYRQIHCVFACLSVSIPVRHIAKLNFLNPLRAGGYYIYHEL
jgi:hypothetical protein